jgi:3-phenylpropionate/trans-cinnamate dioxygenase ferredoxin reductase subunit
MTLGGEPVRYDRLVLATGATPRHLRLPGADLPGVDYLRTLDDSDALRAAFRPGANVVVIGAGWIGLETAAAARGAGATVTVLESAELPLLRVLGPQMGQVFAGLHRENGVDLRLGVTVSAIRGGPSAVTGVELGDGSVVAADTVVVGVGVSERRPRPLGRRGRGQRVLVDASRAAATHIFAVGDLPTAASRAGRRIRVEHWANALHQPEVVAKSVLPATRTTSSCLLHRRTTWLGTSATRTPTTGRRAGDLDAQFVAPMGPRRQVVAGMNVNVWDVTDRIRDVILAGQPADAFELPAPSA